MRLGHIRKRQEECKGAGNEERGLGMQCSRFVPRNGERREEGTSGSREPIVEESWRIAWLRMFVCLPAFDKARTCDRASPNAPHAVRKDGYLLERLVLLGSTMFLKHRAEDFAEHSHVGSQFWARKLPFVATRTLAA